MRRKGSPAPPVCLEAPLCLAVLPPACPESTGVQKSDPSHSTPASPRGLGTPAFH